MPIGKLAIYYSLKNNILELQYNRIILKQSKKFEVGCWDIR